MKLRTRLTSLIVLACLVPLVLTGFVATRIADRLVLRQTRTAYERQARNLAVTSTTWLDSQLRGLELAVSHFRYSELDLDQQAGLLRLLYRQFDAVNALVVLDSVGDPVGQPVRVSDGTELVRAAMEGHEVVDGERLETFLGQPVVTWPEPGQAVLQRAYTLPSRSGNVAPVAVGLPETPGWILVVELSLLDLTRHFQDQAVGGSAAVLVDEEGTVVAGEPGGLIETDVLRSFGGPVVGDLEYELPDGTGVLAAFAAVGRGDWTVGVAVPRAIATRPGREIRARTMFMYGLAIALALVLGLLGSRQLSRRVVDLRDAALRVAEGDLGRRVTTVGSDEIAELSRAFNFMSSSLARNQAVIATHNEEIEAANRELEARVDQRTQALRVVESSRMAAVAQMGAGLAHELNNPVAGILGMAQVAMARDPQGPDLAMLRTIEEQALRCREILAALRRFTENREDRLRQTIDLHAVVREVLGLVGSAFTAAGLELEHTDAPPLPVMVDPALLAQALAQLLRSFRAQLGSTGRLVILGEPGEDEHGLTFLLDGAEAGARDDWLASGMGFWIAKQVLEEHGGRLEEPEPGEGFVYRLLLPATDHPGPERVTDIG